MRVLELDSDATCSSERTRETGAGISVIGTLGEQRTLLLRLMRVMMEFKSRRETVNL
jgi:hypothetical protein